MLGFSFWTGGITYVSGVLNQSVICNRCGYIRGHVDFKEQDEEKGVDVWDDDYVILKNRTQQAYPLGISMVMKSLLMNERCDVTNRSFIDCYEEIVDEAAFLSLNGAILNFIRSNLPWRLINPATQQTYFESKLTFIDDKRKMLDYE